MKFDTESQYKKAQEIYKELESKKITKLSINNYENSILYTYELKGSKYKNDSFDWEYFITNDLGYSLNNIEWFLFKDMVQIENTII